MLCILSKVFSTTEKERDLTPHLTQAWEVERSKAPITDADEFEFDFEFEILNLKNGN